MKILRLLSWFLRLVLFLLLLAFAVMNSGAVTLRFFFDRSWQVPLVLLLLVTLALGALLGLLACMAQLFRGRRENLALRRELRALDAGTPGVAGMAVTAELVPPPPADAAS